MLLGSVQFLSLECETSEHIRRRFATNPYLVISFAGFTDACQLVIIIPAFLSRVLLPIPLTSISSSIS